MDRSTTRQETMDIEAYAFALVRMVWEGVCTYLMRVFKCLYDMCVSSDKL